MRLHAFLAIAVMLFVANIAHAQSCTYWNDVGPTVGIDPIADGNFSDTSCGAWQYTGNAYKSSRSGDYAGRIDSDAFTSSTIYQNTDFSSFTGSAFAIGFYFDKTINSGAGTEVMRVQIRRVSDDAVLETVTSLSPSSASGTYSFTIGNYSGQNVRLVFSVSGGRNYGDTTFWVDGVHLWADF